MSLLIVTGLVFGGIYAVAALGLVLTYSASGVFNFAHGAIAFLVAMTYHQFVAVWDWPIWVAAVVALGVVAPGLGVLLWAVLFRRLAGRPTAVQLVATIGLSVAIPAIVALVFTELQPSVAPGFFRQPVPTVDVLGITLNANQVVVLVAAVVVAGGLTWLLRGTGFGLVMRGVVDHRELASTLGFDPAAVTAASWGIGTFLAGLAGVLLAPVLSLTESAFALLLISSFAAAVVGRLRSLPLTFAGAIGLGLAQSLVSEVLPQTGFWARATRPSLPFVVMIAFLVGYGALRYRREGMRGTASVPLLTREAPASWTLRRRLRWAAFGAFLVGLPWLLSSFWMGVVAAGVALSVALLSYVLVAGEGGMISLAQVSLAGVGAITTAQLTTELGWPWGVGVLAGGLVAVPFGLLIAAAGLRLGELYLALATLAFAVLADTSIFKLRRFEQLGSGVRVDDPSLFGFTFGSATRFYFLGLAIFLLGAALIWRVRRSTSGLVLAAMRSAETAARTVGIRTVQVKVSVFGLGAFLAGVGGGLIVSWSGVAVPGSFNALVGLVWLAVVVTWGVRSILGALLAGVTFVLGPALFSAYLPESWSNVPAVLFGLGAIIVAKEPRGILVDVREHWRHLVAARRRARDTRRGAAEPVATASGGQA